MREDAMQGVTPDDTTIKRDAIFQLPIAYIEQKSVLEEHTINDLELLPIDPKKSLYKYVFKPDTLFGERTMQLWSNYYTPDTDFLKESQKLLKYKVKSSELDNEKQEKIHKIWQEIQTETGFHEKYSYIEWGPLKFLNNNSKFLQCLSMYNMSSPIFSLAMPLFFLLLPLLIIKLRGLPITIEKYIELLKVVFKKHQLGQLFNLSKASFEKIMYVIITVIFYFMQIYQNIMSCRKFFNNMSKIHEQLFAVRDYLKNTIKNMEILKTQCIDYKTYEPFIKNMNRHQKYCQKVVNEYMKVTPPSKTSIKKIGQIGHVMKCFYYLYQNKELHDSLEYSFGLNGYIDNLNGIRTNVTLKNMNICKFKTNKTKFTKAYFPSLVNEDPVKNTYTLDKHLIITGPNAAGKTTLLKTTIFNIILSQQVGYGFYKKANIIPYDMIHCYINIPDTSARDSLFQAEAKRCKDILTKVDANLVAVDANLVAVDANATPKKLRHFCVFDELYSGTNPYEAISSAYAFLKYLNKYDEINFVLTTHFLELCRRLEKEKGIRNFHMKIENVNDDFKYTYKLEKGISYIKGGVKVLRDLDYPSEIIKNTNDVLQELDI
jgi:hypothetical protein